jgi:hypothetical protein
MADMNRFAVSALSRDRKAEALPEELLVHKPTGQMLIKRPDGRIISYDKISRLKTHIDFLESSHSIIGIDGDLCLLELDHIELPNTVQYESNILDNPLTLGDSPVSKILISMDIDCMEFVNGEAFILRDLPSIRFEFEFVDENDQTHSVTKTVPLNKLSTNIFNVLNYSPNSTPMNATLNGIYIEENPSNVGKVLENILHSILIILE